MNIKTLDCISQVTIDRVKGMTKDELQAVLDRPFKPSIGNSEFDLEKLTAGVLMAMAKKNE